MTARYCHSTDVSIMDEIQQQQPHDEEKKMKWNESTLWTEGINNNKNHQFQRSQWSNVEQ